MPGLETTLPDILAIGTLRIPAGTLAIRVSTHVRFTVLKTVTRAAYRMQLGGAQMGQGFLVDLNGNVGHFIRTEAEGQVFTENV